MRKKAKNGPMIWKAHIRNMFDELLQCTPNTQLFNQPFRITMNILGAAAEHAAKIQDEKMIGFFCSLALYSFSDPTDPEYDQERTNYYLNKIVDK